MNWNKYLGITVVLSVVVNLLLAGFIIGRLMPEQRFARGHSFNSAQPVPPVGPGLRSDNERGGIAQGADLNILAGVAALSESSRDVVRRVMQKHKDEVREGFRVVREKRRELLTLLSESPENVDKIEAVFNDLAAITAAAQKNSQSLVLEIARELPEGERAAFLRAASSSARFRGIRR